MTIYAKTCICSGFYILLHGLEVHIAVAIYATGHLHGVTSNRLTEILIDQVLERVVVQIVIDGCTGTEFKIGVLGLVDILFQSLVLVKVSIVGVVRLT